MRNTPGLMIGRFAGAPIYLQKSWFPLMALVIVGYGMKLSSWQSLSTVQGYLAATVVAVTLALGVFCHELAHAAVGQVRRVRVSSITLNMWGGQTLMQTTSAPTALWVALAGPAVNFLVAGSCYLVWALTGTADFYGFHLAVQVNIAIGIFNLLPAFPLDGGYAFEALIFMLVGRRSVAHQVVTYTGFLLLALLVSFLVLTGAWQNPITLVVGILLVMYIGAGLLPAAHKLGLNSDTRHPLHTRQLMRPVAIEQEQVNVGSAVQRWDGHSNLLLIRQDKGHPVRPCGVVLASTLQAASESLTQHPLIALAQPLETQHLAVSSGLIDTLDIFHGFTCYQVKEPELTAGRVWLVRDGQHIVGTVTAQDIAATLTKIPGYSA